MVGDGEGGCEEGVGRRGEEGKGGEGGEKEGGGVSGEEAWRCGGGWVLGWKKEKMRGKVEGDGRRTMLSGGSWLVSLR